MDALPAALAPLAAWPQFVCWYPAPIPDKPGKTAKKPCHWQTGYDCDPTDPANWTTADNALAAAARLGPNHGIGFCFTAADPYWFLDIDHCLVDGAWSAEALGLLARLPGCAVEVSHSGQGLHIIGSATTVPEHTSRNTPAGLEFYTEKRFVALTGNCSAGGSAAQDATASIALIAGQFFPPRASGRVVDWTDEPVPGYGGPIEDGDLIAKASKSRGAAAAFAGKASFEDLWLGRVEQNSENDQALANHLAYWTGKNCERMKRLMRQSAMVRDKWDTRRPEGTYLTKTILAACAFVNNVAQGKAMADAAKIEAAAQASGRTARPAGQEFMTPPAQALHFEGCFFLADQTRVFSLPHNMVLQKAAFDVLYGGFLFQVDPQGTKTTASAWDAFTLSRVYHAVIVADLCFRPELPPGTVVTEGKRQLVNSYVPFHCRTVEGDPGPILDLIRRQLPVPEDQRIFLNWLAAFAQYPGIKFPWWPVLQGVQGNGKTFLMALCRYIAGDHYSHLPNAAAMAKTGSQFNLWLFRKTFIGIDEISLTNRRDFLEEFKPVVTSPTLSFEGKGSNQFSGDNRANGMIATNHRDGIPVTADERRYAVFFMAQQSVEDLTRDGMAGDYFPRLWDWAHADGFAIFAHYLKTFPIEAAYDPADAAHRAPKTSSSAEAIRYSLGRVEQEVIEAIEEDRPGFRGGWVSSYYLGVLIDGLRGAGVAHNKRRDMMRALGYDWHPHLPDGRTNNPVMPDGRRVVLYLKKDHLAANLSTPAAIAKAYETAQAATPPRGDMAALAAFSLTPPSD